MSPRSYKSRDALEAVLTRIDRAENEVLRILAELRLGVLNAGVAVFDEKARIYDDVFRLPCFVAVESAIKPESKSAFYDRMQAAKAAKRASMGSRDPLPSFITGGQADA